MGKYLTEKEIEEIIGPIVIDPTFKLMSPDTYNEKKIADKIVKIEHQNLICQAAISLSIIGFGNNNYGKFILNKEVIEIKSLAHLDIKFNNPANSILKDDDITPNRLCRFFRHSIRNYIQNNDIEPYLWRKYSTKKIEFKNICFRGAEYLEDLNLEQQDYLLNTSIGTKVISIS